MKGTIIFGRRGKKTRHFKPHKKRFRFGDDLTPKQIAQKEVKKDMHLSADVKQIPIPRELVRMTERHFHTRFKYEPRFFVYFPKKGKKFPKQRYSYNWAGMSLIPERRTEKHGIVKYTPLRAMIILPKSDLADPVAKNSTLVHELAEILTHQKECMTESPSNQAHYLMKEYENRIGISKKRIDKRAQKMFKDKRSWE